MEDKQTVGAQSFARRWRLKLSLGSARFVRRRAPNQSAEVEQTRPSEAATAAPKWPPAPLLHHSSGGGRNHGARADRQHARLGTRRDF